MSKQVSKNTQVPAGANTAAPTTAPTKASNGGNGKETLPVPSVGSSLSPQPPQTTAQMAVQNNGKSGSNNGSKPPTGYGNQNQNGQSHRSQQPQWNHNRQNQGRWNDHGKDHKDKQQQKYGPGPSKTQNNNIKAANEQTAVAQALPKGSSSRFGSGDVRLEENTSLERRNWSAQNSGNGNNGYGSRFGPVQDIRLLENPNLEHHVYKSKGGELVTSQENGKEKTNLGNTDKENPKADDAKQENIATSTKPKFIPPHLRSKGLAPKGQPTTNPKIEPKSEPKEPKQSFEIDLDRQYESNVGLFCGEPGVGVLFMVDREPLKRESTWFRQKIGDKEISFIMNEDPTVVQLMLQYIHLGNFDEHAAKVPKTAAELKKQEEKSSLESPKNGALPGAETIFVKGISPEGRMFAHEEIASRLNAVVKLARNYGIHGLGKLASTKLKSLIELMATYKAEVEKRIIQLKQEMDRCNQVKRTAEHFTMMIDNYFGRDDVEVEGFSQTINKINGIFPATETNVGEKGLAESENELSLPGLEDENKSQKPTLADKEAKEISDNARSKSAESEQTKDHLIKVTEQAPAKGDDPKCAADTVTRVEEFEQQNEAPPEKDSFVTATTGTSQGENILQGDSNNGEQDMETEELNTKAISQHYAQKLVCGNIKDEEILGDKAETGKDVTTTEALGQNTGPATNTKETMEGDENGVKLKDTEELGQSNANTEEKTSETGPKSTEGADKMEEAAGADEGGVSVEGVDMKDLNVEDVSEQ
ncbi:hypothetical protein AA313_de0207691 [Arthrobotrys entomopaga]|nr:hypothetical protein AA313_de0207691 [Arthrobotrys entomopaga]